MIILIYTVGFFIGSISAHSDFCEKFPKNFSFGVATNAYQGEGAWNRDGKGPSILDTFSHDFPEKVADRSNADTSADSYDLYPLDINSIKMMQMDHYCFSISWARVLPDGRTVNPAGIRFYKKLIDSLLGEGIEPIVTMFRYDVPQSIQDSGGFTNKAIVDYFKKYADVLFHYFGDRVKKWITIDSPSILCNAIYGEGYLAPTVEPMPGIGEYLCGENVLKAHATVYRLYQKRYAKRFGGKVGITLYADYYYSEKGNKFDVEKALAFQLGWFAEAIFGRGDYPAIMRKQIDKLSRQQGFSSSRLPVLPERWIRKIRGSADFMGLIYYSSRIVKSIRQPSVSQPLTPSSNYLLDAYLEYTVNPEWKRAKTIDLYSVPSGLRDLLRYINGKYNNPKVLIARNGWSDDGQLIDLDRIEYLRTHLEAALNSICKDGSNLIGYTVWGLYNSFENAEGYTAKFGLFDINYADPRLPETPKASAEFMRVVSSTHRIPKKVNIGKGPSNIKSCTTCTNSIEAMPKYD